MLAFAVSEGRSDIGKRPLELSSTYPEPYSNLSQLLLDQGDMQKRYSLRGVQLSLIQSSARPM